MATQYSNSKQLLVYQVQPDDRAGWRYEAVDIENGTVLINDWVIASGDFQQIMNGVGSGSIFLPKSDPVIEEAMKQGATKKAVLVRAYLDGLFQYGFFLEFKTDEMTDNGGYLVRFHGAGMESIADDMKIRPKDHPNLPSTVETWIYGSTDNLVSNAALDDTDLPDNPDGSEGNDGEGHPLNWNKRGKLSAYESVYSPGDGYDGRDWYIRFKPSEHHSGLTNTIPITPGKFAHIRAYVREPDGLAQRYTLAVGGDTDIEAYGTVYTNQFEHNNEILAELDNVATGTGGCPGGASDGTWQVMDVEVKAGSEQTSLEISIQHDHHPTCGDFDNSYPELHIGLIEVEAWGVNLDPWETFQDDNHAANSFRRDDLTSYPGTDYSLRLNPLSQFAGTQQTFAVQGNQRYRGEIKAYITTATAGDRIKLELVDPRTNSVLVSDDPELVSGSWVTAAVDYTMPLTIEEIDYRIVYAGPNNPGPIYLSQFSLVPGAPASFPGKILNDIITPIQTRGTHNYLNLDFTDDKDSSGRDWHSKVSMDINPGSSVLDVLNRLVALGYEWRIAPSGYADGGGSSGFNLQVWNSRDIDSTSGMGSRLTGDEDPVIHTGEAITSGDTKIQTRRPNVVYVHGKNGYWTEVFQDDYAAYEAVMGRIEAHIDVGDVQDQSTLADFGKAFLLDEKLREQGFRLSFARTAGIRPYRDFRVGDSVFVDAPPEYPDPDRATERRVRSIHVSTGGEGADIKYEVDFDRVTYRDDAALLAVIAQLSERAPTDTSGEGTGSVSASGSVTISNDGGTVSPHTHAMGDLTGKTLKGDVSGQVDGNIRVNKIKSIPVDVTIPAEVAGQTSYLEYNYANVSFALGQAKIPAVIDDLTDVDLTVAPTNEQALVFDNVSGKWKAADQAGDTADIQVPTVQAVSSEYEGNTSVVVNNNLGGKLDEMYLMLVWCHKNTNGNVINTPTGFTYICEPGDATSDVSVGAFYRIVDGTEPSTWTVSNTVSENMTIRLLRIVNAATVSPIDVVGAEANTISGTSSTVASITTLTDRSLAVSLVGGDVSTAGLFSTASTGWTSSPNEQAYVNASGNWATKPMPAAGATGSVVWTWASGNFGTTNINFAIKPGDGLPNYLEDLTDVRGAPPAPTDGQVLTFDSTTLSWGPEDAGGSSSPTTTLGDIIKRGASADERLAIGTTDQVLTVVSGEPAWANSSGGLNPDGTPVQDSTIRYHTTGPTLYSAAYPGSGSEGWNGLVKELDLVAAPPTAVASSELSTPTYEAEQVLDQDAATLWHSDGVETNPTLYLQLPASQKWRATHWGIQGRSSAGTHLDDFTIQGSNDGSGWTTLATVTTAGIGAGTWKSGTLTVGNYQYLRVNMSDTLNGSDDFSMGSLEFWGTIIGSADDWAVEPMAIVSNGDAFAANGDIDMDGNFLDFTASFADKDIPVASTSGTVTGSWTFDTAANDGLINGVGGLNGESAEGVDVITDQSSVFNNLGSSNALDTDITTGTGRSHTTLEATPWWEMIFIGARVFEWEDFAIRAQAHGDGFLAQDFDIRGRDPVTGVWTTYASSNTDPGNSNWISYDIAAGNGGVPPVVDGIRIEAADTNYLVLGSVEAWGTYYESGITNSWGTVPIGTNDQVLTVVAGQPTWADNGGANTVTAGKVSGAELRLTAAFVHNSTGNWLAIDWDAEDYDDDAYWEGVTNPERITFAEKGRYEVIANAIFASNATGERFIRIIRNGTATNELALAGPFPATSFGDQRYQCSVIVDAEVDDYVTVEVYQNSGGNLNIIGAGSAGDDTETSRVQVNRLDVQSGYAGPQLAQAKVDTDITSITASTYYPIDMDSEVIDTNAGWEGVTNPSRFTAWVDGTYEVSASIRLDGDAGGDDIQIAGFRINGTGTEFVEDFGRQDGSGSYSHFNGSQTIELTKGDYVEFVAYMNGTTTRTIRAGTRGTLKLLRLSPDIAVAAIAYQTADNSITAGDGNEELVGLGAIESETPSGVVDTANDTFVAPVDGFYEIGGLIAFGAGPANEVRVSLFLNGTEISIASSLFRGDLDATFRNAALANRVVKMDAGDTLSVSVWVESTATVRGSSTKTASWLSFKRVTNGAYGNTTPEWLTWDPNWRDSADTALNAGTGVAVESFRYQKVGSTVHIRMDIKIGTSPTLGAGTRWDFDLPYTMNAPMDGVAFGSGAVNEDGAGIYPVWGWLGTAASKEFYLIADDGTPPSSTAVDFDTPFTWATPDTLHFEATYETDE